MPEALRRSVQQLRHRTQQVSEQLARAGLCRTSKHLQWLPVEILSVAIVVNSWFTIGVVVPPREATPFHTPLTTS